MWLCYLFIHFFIDSDSIAYHCIPSLELLVLLALIAGNYYKKRCIIITLQLFIILHVQSATCTRVNATRTMMKKAKKKEVTWKITSLLILWGSVPVRVDLTKALAQACDSRSVCLYSWSHCHLVRCAWHSLKGILFSRGIGYVARPQRKAELNWYVNFLVFCSIAMYVQRCSLFLMFNFEWAKPSRENHCFSAALSIPSGR